MPHPLPFRTRRDHTRWAIERISGLGALTLLMGCATSTAAEDGDNAENRGVGARTGQRKDAIVNGSPDVSGGGLNDPSGGFADTTVRFQNNKCTGLLVTPQLIITVNHCVSGTGPDFKNLPAGAAGPGAQVFVAPCACTNLTTCPCAGMNVVAEGTPVVTQTSTLPPGTILLPPGSTTVASAVPLRIAGATMIATAASVGQVT